MLVLGYVRVSTEEQAREGVSLEAQEARIRAYCVAHDLELARVESDAGESAKDLRRPAWLRVRGALRRGEVEGVVFVKLDRLSRSTRDVIGLIDASGREGWSLHSIAESLDTSSAMGRFFVRMLANLAELERDQVSERVSAALGYLRDEGKRISGRPPFGYRFEGGELVEVACEQVVLARLVSMREGGQSLRAIAAALNGAGELHPRTGRVWRFQTVAKILATASRRAG